MSLSRRKITTKVDLLLRGHVTPTEKAEAMDIALAIRGLNSGVISATLQWLYLNDAPLTQGNLDDVLAALDEEERKVAANIGIPATVELFDSFFDDDE